MRSVVITGVSSGIGLATAGVLVREGIRVFGSVRKSSDADRLKEQFGDLFSPLIFDLTDYPAVAESARAVRSALGGSTLFGLVNNAGVAVAAPLLEVSIDDFRRQFEVNLFGHLNVIKAFAPMLGVGAAPNLARGRIVNITSLGGRIGLPFLGPYIASKHGFEGLSESLRRELIPYGIDVIIVGPGGVATPIYDKGDQLEIPPTSGVYREPLRRFKDQMVTRGRKGLPPERIGRIVLTALTTPRPRVRYAAVTQPLRNWILPRLLPRRFVDRLIAHQLGLNRYTQRLPPAQTVTAAPPDLTMLPRDRSE